MAFADPVSGRGVALSAETPEPDTLPRKRRTTVYVVGSAFAAAGLTMGTMPFFAELTPILVAKGCAAVGAAILAFGRFAPDHLLKRIIPKRR